MLPGAAALERGDRGPRDHARVAGLGLAAEKLNRSRGRMAPQVLLVVGGASRHTMAISSPLLGKGYVRYVSGGP